MRFYFCGSCINIDADEKKVEQDMYTAVLHFGVLVIVMDIRSGKIILKDFSVTSDI